ncbi:NUDIX domain-containing protein [Pedobacter boryungensis]|uniref:NUDIX domain-containing protein n=1 Tax=Pedobacter boryungensis TaxID=869962 RepID=A0ABX2DC01_9SPHI|nr:NUDIX domain-containing protein [Pedobacter boryungensis]NQX31089.1 NUDIX domain-containing protein [Pedobacter boryungensis]
MKLLSAGILAYRKHSGIVEFFLVHPGGPFFAKKELGVWTVPKGLVEGEDELLATAKREFLEETGFEVQGNFIDLGHIVQKGGKKVYCFGVEFDLDSSAIKSNTFEMQWPPGSGKISSFPEIDRGEWLDLKTAKEKINPQQAELLDRLLQLL